MLYCQAIEINKKEDNMNSFIISKAICNKFGVPIIATEEITTGLINSTLMVTAENGKKYILQEINSQVFPNVDRLMNNIDMVTSHIKQKLAEEHRDVETGTLNLLNDDKGKNYVCVYDNLNKPHYYRMYAFISKASTYDEASNELLYQAGVGFGRFQRHLADFPAEKLYDSIPDFHNTLDRYTQFSKALERCISKGEKEMFFKAKDEIMWAQQHQPFAGIIMNELNNHNIPLRVVHNDTKLNNVMLDNVTHEPVCVIDLDTVMPGSLLFDYGDAIRYCANTGVEDATIDQLKNVSFDLEKFKSFTDGFLKETSHNLTKREVELMPVAPAVLSYELGLRFLTDYLNGNKYFKCDSSRPDHNLDRARSQFTLMKDMMTKKSEMTNIINDLYSKNLQSDFVK